VSFPNLFYALAFAGAFASALIALPLWRKWCARSGLVDDPGHRKIHAEPIPLAGGLAVMTALVLPVLAGLLVLFAQQKNLISIFNSETADRLNYGLKKRSVELAAIFLGAFGMLLVGLLDDKHELKPSAKFAGQFFVALLVAAAGARVTLFVHNAIFSYAITILWIVTVINAFNFMDNMNGLCAGLGAIGAFYFGFIAATSAVPQYLVALIAFLTCGALLGFLPYNFPRARAFLGDAGSHLVGYLLAVLAILPHFYTPKHPRTFAVFTPLFVLAVPLGDMVWVVLLRTKMGKPFYIGDNNHLSHRLVRRGLSRAKAVVLIWLLAAIVGALAIF
jgi:UDP-GlcNAc:undecaprenyl-phosphate GlcNAc-1-phosphate transferase